MNLAQNPNAIAIVRRFKSTANGGMLKAETVYRLRDGLARLDLTDGEARERDTRF